MKEIELFIDESGKMTFIYDDELSDLCDEGDFSTKRASHVEPSGSGWTADMSPILDTVDLQMQQEAVCLLGGPVLGPFSLRKDALDAEVKWIRSFLGIISNETMAEISSF